MQHQTYLQTAQTGGVAILKQGYGFKKGGLRNHAYKRRWFVLTEDGRLLYFESSDSTAPLGLVILADATLETHRTDDYKLIIKTKSRAWGLKYDNQNICAEWTECIQSVVNLIASKAKPNAINALHLDKDKRLKALATGAADGALSDVTVTCFTWNLGSRLPDIREIQFLKKLILGKLVAFGLQEYQAAGSNILTSPHEKNQRPPLDIWNAMLQSTLGGDYCLVSTKCMGCMALTCFAHTDIADAVSVVATGSVPCGIGNVLYNKGAVSISISIQGTKFSFISAHLPAHHSKVQERNGAYRRIVELMPAALAQEWKEDNIEFSDRQVHKSGDSEFIAKPLSFKRGCDILSKRLLGKDSETPVDSWALFEQVSFDRYIVEFDDEPEDPDQLTRVDADITSDLDNTRAADKTAPPLPAMGADGEEKAVHRVQECTVDAVVHDRYFFFGDLNFRLDAGKIWIESMIEMAHIFAEKERRCSPEADSRQDVSGPVLIRDEGSSEYPEGVDSITSEAGEADISTIMTLTPNIPLPLPPGDELEERCSNSPTVELMEKSEIEELRLRGMAKWRLNSINNNKWDEGLLARDADEENCVIARTITSSSGGKDEWKDWQKQNEKIQAEKGPMDLFSRVRLFVQQTGLQSSTGIYEHLMLYDQLKNEMREGHILNGFSEGAIRFPPTYKFDPYSRKYDTGKKARRPAWCDRILFSSTPPVPIADKSRVVSGPRSGDVKVRRTVPGLDIIQDLDAPQHAGSSAAKTESRGDQKSPAYIEGITLLEYDSIDWLFASDHRPVYAHFCVSLLDNC